MPRNNVRFSRPQLRICQHTCQHKGFDVATAPPLHRPTHRRASLPSSLQLFPKESFSACGRAPRPTAACSVVRM